MQAGSVPRTLLIIKHVGAAGEAGVPVWPQPRGAKRK